MIFWNPVGPEWDPTTLLHLDEGTQVLTLGGVYFVFSDTAATAIIAQTTTDAAARAELDYLPVGKLTLGDLELSFLVIGDTLVRLFGDIEGFYTVPQRGDRAS